MTEDRPDHVGPNPQIASSSGSEGPGVFGTAQVAGVQTLAWNAAGIPDPLQIFISEPIGLAEGERAGVLYMTDADFAGFGTIGYARIAQQMGSVAPVMVVAIGYRGQTIAQVMKSRMRDFTSEPLAIELPPEHAGPTGNAPALADFIVGTLKPWVEARYAVDPAKSVLIGGSAGGLFSLYALTRYPQSFAGIGAANAGLGLGRGVMAGIEHLNDVRGDLKVYLSNGSLEADDPFYASIGMVRYCQEAHRALGAQGIKSRYDYFEGLDHSESGQVAQRRMVSYFFPR